MGCYDEDHNVVQCSDHRQTTLCMTVAMNCQGDADSAA